MGLLVSRAKTKDGYKLYHTRTCKHVKRSSKLPEWPRHDVEAAMEHGHVKKCPECEKIEGR